MARVDTALRLVGYGVTVALGVRWSEKVLNHQTS